MNIKMLALVAAALFPMMANASNFAVYGSAGTNGLGLGAGTAINDNFGARLGFNTFKVSTTQQDANGNYGIDLKLMTVSGLADYYPWAGKFRTTLGAVYNGNKAAITAQPVGGGSYVFNGQTYSSADVGSFSGEMTFNSVAPYLGIGWGNPAAQDKQWGMTMDIGVLFQGSPKISNAVTCGAGVPALTCAQMQSDVAAGAAKLEADTKDFKYLPVVNLGISYRF
ncbi:MAG: hypothetical protein PHP57_03030 [Sideroxydans sp.]|nr:hypothetical protein [Sideroxydans sp.]